MLHDAFFKHQTKPSLTRPGDLYYEGKEFEARNKEHKPGQISAELREVRALIGLVKHEDITFDTLCVLLQMECFVIWYGSVECLSVRRLTFCRLVLIRLLPVL